MTPMMYVEVTLGSETNNTDSLGMAVFYSVEIQQELYYSVSSYGYQSVEGSMEIYRDTSMGISLLPLVDIKNHDAAMIQLYPNPVSSKLYIRNI